jgi:hypothetical protein
LAVVEQLTLVVFPAVTAELHHLLAVQFQSAHQAAVAVVLQAVTVTTAVQVVVLDTHLLMVELAMLAVTHHRKELTAAKMALHRAFMRQAAAVVRLLQAQQVTAQLAVVTVVTDHQLIHHGVQQLLQVKMSAVHIGTPAVAVVEYSAAAA